MTPQEMEVRIRALERVVKDLVNWKETTILRLRNRRLLQEENEIALNDLINDIDPLGQG